MTIDKIINESRLEDFANTVIEYGKLAYRRVCDFGDNAMSYCKDTMFKITEIWNETVVPALKDAWENAKPHVDRAVEWIKTPIVSSSALFGVGLAAVVTAQNVENTTGKFAMRALGITSVVVGALKLRELI